MAYYLTIKRKNEYHEIDISSLKEFERLSKFKRNSYSLEEIDNCTSKFENEIDFKRVLYENNLIQFEDITKEISIRVKYKNNLDKIRYGLIYIKQRKYLDCNYLRLHILILQNNEEFLRKLVSNYRNSYCNNITISKITNYLNKNFIIDIYNTLNEFFLNEIFSKNDSGEVKLKYKSLHDLAMFVYNYDEYYEKKSLGISEKSESIMVKKQLLELQRNLITKNESSVKFKKKELKNKQLEGQISLFD